jgi:hypothetical protein
VFLFLASCLTLDPAPDQEVENSLSLTGEVSSTPTQNITETPTPTTVWFPPTQTPTPFPTPDFPPTPEMRPDFGRAVLLENFDNGDSWTLGRSGSSSVALGKNELTIAIAPSSSRVYAYSVRQEPVLTNFYAEITASPSLCRGNDEYGILVRYNSAVDYYRFSLSCDGQARLDRIFQGQASSPQPWVASGSIARGAPSITRLAVWASGREMRFFANEEHLFTVNDSLLPSGSLGIFARSSENEALTVNFSALEVWEIDP